MLYTLAVRLDLEKMRRTHRMGSPWYQSHNKKVQTTSKAAFTRKSEENRVKACIMDTSWGLSTTPGNHSSWIDVKIANGLGLIRTNDLFEETMAKGGKVSV